MGARSTNEREIRGCCASRRRTLRRRARLGVVLAAALSAAASPALGQGKVYWTDVGAHALLRADKDGSGAQLLSSVVSSFPTAIAVDPVAGKMYWTDPGTGSISRANLDVTNIQQIVGPPYAPYASDLVLDLSAGKIYWVDESDDVIRRGDLADLNVGSVITNIEDVITTGLSEPRGVDLDLKRGKLYWTDFAFGHVERANLDGTGREVVVSDLSDRIESIAIDPVNERIYWTENDPSFGHVRRSDLNGQNVETLYDEVVEGELRGVIVDPEPPIAKVYWARRGGNTSAIRRANLDGSGAQDIVSNLFVQFGQPFGLALDDVLCGNGAVDPGEECDEADFVDGDGCSATCRDECGNGRVDGGEDCDDGPADENICTDDCTFNVCGDGVPGGPGGDGVPGGSDDEECDDGPADENLCTSDCTLNVCGDGVPGGPDDEECDDGPADQNVCKNDCTLNVCGDGVPGGPGGDGVPGGSDDEECDDGDDDKTDACVRCRHARCGDGEVQAGVEECERPGTDECDATCLAAPYCGDAPQAQQQVGVCKGGATRQSCSIDDDCDVPFAEGSCGTVRTCTQGRIGSPCINNAECDVAQVSGRCDLQQICVKGRRFRSCTSDSDCSPGGRCYTEPCDDGNGNNNDACVERDGSCLEASCGDGFVRSGYETCDPPHTGKCDGSCQKRTTCRRRLCGLSFLDTGASQSRNGRVQICEDGQDCVEGNECHFRVVICLGNPDLAVSCQPTELVSIDFVSLDVREDWHATLADQLTYAMGAFGATTKKPGRCVEGLRGKLCTAHDDCDRFLGDAKGECSTPTGVEFSPMLVADQGEAKCTEVDVRIPAGRRLILKSRVRGYVTGQALTEGPKRDDDHVRLVCRIGRG